MRYDAVSLIRLVVASTPPDWPALQDVGHARRGRIMTDGSAWKERLVDRLVTYHIEVDGRLFVIENVPARVDVETGENHFAPDTVERLQRIMRERRSPVRIIEAPVFEFA